MAQSESETLGVLLEVGRLLSSKLDIADLLKTVLELASRTVEAETASLLLLDEETQELYFDVALGLGEEASKVRLKPGEGIAGCVARDRKPKVINDVRSDPRWFAEIDKKSGFVTRSILAVPMTVKGRLIGVIEAINKRGGDFTEMDLNNFELFAAEASIAIENARLFSSLKEEKFKLDTIFSEMADGAALADESGRILLANAAASRYLGIAPGETGGTIAEALRGMTVTPSLREMAASKAPSHNFIAAREKPKKLILGGKAIRIELAGRSFGPAQPRLAPQSGWLYVFRDETEARRIEKLKRTFLSLISHKLKTPLAAVTGFADLLLEEFRDSPPPEMQFKAAETIASQGKKLAELVDKLLRYTTLESPDDTIELVLIQLDAVVGEAMLGMKDWLSARGAAVLYRPAENTQIIGDGKRLREMLKNLIENSVKFDPKPEKKVMVSIETDERWARLIVADKGPGIPPEDQEKIFQRFHQIEESFTGQVEGWGLGLPFVKKVVDQHGGQVELVSKLGAGTTVTVILPRRLDFFAAGGAGSTGAEGAP